MILCPAGSMPPSTSKAKQLKRIIEKLILIQLLLALFSIQFNILSFSLKLISAFILYVSIVQINYCNAVVYLGLILYDLIIMFCIYGEKIQMKTFYLYENVFTDGFYNKEFLYLLNNMFTVVLYVITGNQAFEAYKEFKGICYDLLDSQNDNFGIKLELQENSDTNTSNTINEDINIINININNQKNNNNDSNNMQHTIHF